jgi:hypothetical protein
MESIKNILKKFNPLEDKYISREFQAFGLYLAKNFKMKKEKVSISN